MIRKPVVKLVKKHAKLGEGTSEIDLKKKQKQICQLRSNPTVLLEYRSDWSIRVS